MLHVSRTTTREDNSPHITNKAQLFPPGPQSLGLFPTRTTAHFDHYHGIKPLIRTKTCTGGNCPGGGGVVRGGELSGYEDNYESFFFPLYLYEFCSLISSKISFTIICKFFHNIFGIIRNRESNVFSVITQL